MTEKTVTVTIDGEEVQAREGEMVLAACRRLGKDIPTLCHHDALEPYASCRVCMVEVTVRGWTSLVTACHYPVRDGLIVRTDSEAVLEARRVVLELLLSRCPKSEVIRDLAAQYGVTEPPYECDDPDEGCILCGLCVRICAAVMEDPSLRKEAGTSRASAGGIGFAGRGVDRKVTSPFELPLEQCIGCEACINVCPTGYVMKRLEAGKLIIDSWHAEVEEHRCASCGKAFLTEKQIALIKERSEKEVEGIELCPSCRRKKAGEDLKSASKAMNALKTGTIHVP